MAKGVWFLSRFQHSDGGMRSRGRAKNLNLYLFIMSFRSSGVSLCHSNFHSYIQIPPLASGGGQLIPSISCEMFGCSLSFSRYLEHGFTFQWYLKFHFPDFIFFSFFASQKYAVLCQSASHLLFIVAVQVLGLPFA